MALFHPSANPPFTSRQCPQADPLPPIFKRLQVYCHAHFGPVPMKHIGWGASAKGQPFAVYACPVCNSRQSWVRDYRTGRPYCLFTTPGR